MTDGNESFQGGLTNDAAWKILSAIFEDYLATTVNTPVGKRRPAEILGEAALKDGNHSLAVLLSDLDDAIVKASQGHYRALSFLIESPIAEELHALSAPTAYRKTVEIIARPVLKIIEELHAVEPDVDWNAAGDVLQAVKAAAWPHHVGMREKLDIWSRQNSSGRNV